MIFSETNRPKYVYEQTYRISASDCVSGLTASLPALTNLLQEVAGVHAEALGVGIQALQAMGFTWMLARLSVHLFEAPAWREEVRITTWPSGVRGRLMAERHFVIESVATGKRFLEASSEWLYVNFQTQRLSRLPESIVNLGHPDVLAFDYCAKKIPLFPIDAPLLGETTLHVRRGEIDANLHVNNVHYTEWMRETLPEALFVRGVPRRYDIEYKQAAKWGDIVTVRTVALSANCVGHTVVRSDGVVLACAVSDFGC